MHEEESLLQFPCEFPIKIMGAAVPEFRERVLEIVRRHAPEVDGSRVREAASREGRYLSITVTLRAESREQLDGLYRELTGCELVAVVL
jgi:putative lipoic acid-binding regulatory protein